MDLAYDERQRSIKATARAFLTANSPLELLRELEGKSPGYSQELWGKMTDLGWLGINLPERYGGEGQGFLDLYVIYEEMGRALTSTPHLSTVALAGEILLREGSEDQRRRFLPAIAQGKLVIATAIIEPNATYGHEGVELKADRDGATYRLDGVKLLVPFADSADWILCAARTNRGGLEDGITLLLLEQKASGIGIERLPNIAGLPLFAVTFDGVRISSDSVVGRPNAGWAAYNAAATRAGVLQCAEICGAGERMVEMVAAYAKDRVQFGRPIGSFQAVQYLCTDVAIEASTASLLARQAAWLIHEHLPYAREASIACAASSKAAERMTRQAQEVFAGIGFMLEHDMQLFTRRAKFWELNLGDANSHLEAVAEALEL